MRTDAALANRPHGVSKTTVVVFSIAFFCTIAIIVAAIALRLILALALMVGVGVMQATALAPMEALRHGDSNSRLVVLTHLVDTYESQPAAANDPALAAALLPLVEQCRLDPDKDVVDLAEDLICILSANVGNPY